MQGGTYTVVPVSQHQIALVPLAGCSNNGKITVTFGLEWTPGGYRSFQKIDGHDDSLAGQTEGQDLEIEYKPISISSNSGEITISNRKQAYSGSDRDKYFTYLDPDDTDSLLELVAIAHRPMELIVRASGFASSSYDTIRHQTRTGLHKDLPTRGPLHPYGARLSVTATADADAGL